MRGTQTGVSGRRFTRSRWTDIAISALLVLGSLEVIGSSLRRIMFSLPWTTTVLQLAGGILLLVVAVLMPTRLRKSRVATWLVIVLALLALAWMASYFLEHSLILGFVGLTAWVVAASVATVIYLTKARRVKNGAG